MRSILLFMVAAMVALAGCSGDDDTIGDGGSSDDPTTLQPPEGFTETGTLRGIAIAVGAVGGVASTGDECMDPEACTTVPFSIDAEWQMTAMLSMMNGPITGATEGVLYGTDYDLYLYEAGGRLIADSTNSAGQDDMIRKTLDAGDYEFLIVAWNAPDGGSYTLDVRFDVPPEPLLLP